MKYLLTLAACWALAAAAHAQTPPDAPAKPAPPQESRWRLGLAAGYGLRTNPLIQSKDIPVIVDLDIAWFGERWFFDNGDLGFELFDRPRFTTNVVARVNSDRAFFAKTNARYINFSYLGGGTVGPATDPSTGTPLVEPVLVKPPKRDYAVELGIEILLDGEWGQSSLHAIRDVSGTHNGFEFSADYSYRLTRGRLSVSPSVGVSYKSAALSDYYWGVHADEAQFVLPRYVVKGGVGWEAGLRTSYYLTKSLRLAVSANYERLQHSIAMSPLVKRDYVFGYFAGLGWQF